MTLKEYCQQLGWNTSTLARAANLNEKTAHKALAGRRVYSRTAQAIASALTAAMGKAVYPGDIEGLELSERRKD